MRLILIAALVVLFGGAPADAMPVAAVAALAATASSFLATPLIAIGSTTLLTVGNLLALGVTVGASLLFNRTPGQQSIDPGDMKGTVKGSESPEINGIGRIRVGMVKFFGNTRDDRRYRLGGHINGPWDGPEDHYIGGREIIVDTTTGYVTSPPWVTEGGSLAHIWQLPGDGTETAWSQLITDFPSLWTSAHKIPGIAQSLIRFDSPGIGTEKFLQLYQGDVPDYETVCRAQKNIYDPRTATYKWTDNGILGCLYILLLWPEITLADIDLDHIADEADKADAPVATLTGTEKRSRLWGVWSSEETREATLSDALSSAGAMIVQRPNDKISIALIDDIPTSERSLNSLFIKNATWKSGLDGVDRPNIARVWYYSPERGFQMTEIDLTGIAWARLDGEVDEYGPKYKDFKYKFCPSASQAQRNARREFALLMADGGSIVTQMPGAGILGCSYFAFDLPDGCGTALSIPGTIEVRDGGDQAEVEIPYRVVPTLTAFNPATDEAPAPPEVPDLTRESDIAQPSITAGPTVVIWPGGAGIVTRYAYGIPSGATGMEAVYRTYLDAYRWNEWKGMVEVVAESGYAYAYQVADLRLTACDFRVRGATAEGDLSKWSNPPVHATPVVDNTAPDAPVLTAAYVEPTGDPPPPPYINVQIDIAEDLNVSYVHLVIDVGIDSFVDEIIPCGPGQRIGRTYEEPADGTYDIEITSHASDGTSSPSDTDSVVVGVIPP